MERSCCRARPRDRDLSGYCTPEKHSSSFARDHHRLVVGPTAAKALTCDVGEHQEETAVLVHFLMAQVAAAECQLAATGTVVGV